MFSKRRPGYSELPTGADRAWARLLPDEVSPQEAFMEEGYNQNYVRLRYLGLNSGSFGLDPASCVGTLTSVDDTEGLKSFLDGVGQQGTQDIGAMFKCAARVKSLPMWNIVHEWMCTRKDRYMNFRLFEIALAEKFDTVIFNFLDQGILKDDRLSVAALMQSTVERDLEYLEKILSYVDLKDTKTHVSCKRTLAAFAENGALQKIERLAHLLPLESIGIEDALRAAAKGRHYATVSYLAKGITLTSDYTVLLEVMDCMSHLPAAEFSEFLKDIKAVEKKKNFSQAAASVLLTLIEAGSVEKVALLDPIVLDEHGRAPLLKAFARPHPGILEILLPRFREIDPADKFGNVLLMSAIRSGKIGFLRDVLAKLSMKGDPSAKAFGSLLIVASADSSPEMVRLMLDAKADANYDGMRPVFAALKAGRKDNAEVLLAHGARISIFGESVLRDIAMDHDAPKGIVEWFEQVVQNDRVVPAPREDVDMAQVDGFTKLASYAVSQTLTLPTGAQLTTVFDFAAERCLVLSEGKVLVGEQPPLIATNFSDLESEVAVERAGDALIKLQGDVQLVEEYRNRTIRPRGGWK